MPTTDSREESGREGTDRRRHSVKILDVIDVLAKFIAALALIVGAYIANSYQGKMTGTTLLSQREESETQLRASMLNSLIEPIIGQEKGAKIHPDRERILVELLALNFHEHFELKPLMTQVDERLASQSGGMTREQAKRARYSLWSVAHRVASQQVASLIREEPGNGPNEAGCSIYLLTMTKELSPNEENRPRCQANGKFEEPIRLESPDKKWTLNAVAYDPDSENQTVQMTTSLVSNAPTGQQVYNDIAYKFTLSWYSFPLTDNTLLPDGNRFAITLDRGVEGGSASLRLIWFPKDYITPRERPLNYREIHKLVGEKKE